VLKVTFYGVRGSTPSPCDSTRRYGGNTSCVALEFPDEPPVVLDLGTGLRFFGETQPTDGTFKGTAFVSHLHWDHIQGLPFFVPILRDGACLDIYAPPQEDGRSTGEAFDYFMRAPYFPVTVDDLPGSIRFHDLGSETVRLGAVEAMARTIPHVGPTNGYRVSWNGLSVAYLPDHQQPSDGGFRITDEALELAEGVDLLIHDAQYTRAEFQQKSTWGHCTYEYACWVAKRAKAKRLALFHHDPVRSDEALDEVVGCCETLADQMGFEVMAAAERTTVALEPAAPRRR
jgi:phosphoribosyl 1,2-cyclic phosphodiesterase